MGITLRDYRRIHILILFSVLLLSLASCQKELAKPLDKDLVKENSCQPPCWNGIVPGKSTYGDAIAALEALKKHNFGSYKDGSVGERKVIRWKGGESKAVDMVMDKGIVNTIRFSVSYGTLEEIIQTFGEPEYFFRGTTIDTQDAYWIDLFYPQKGIMISVQGKFKPGNKIVITPEMPVSFAEYMIPKTIEAFIVDLYGEEHKGLKIRQWKGYGEVSLFPE